MAKKKFVVGCFDNEDLLFPAVKKVRTAGYKIHDIYTPFPVHGLDHAMGLRETSLHTAGFIYGITGTATALGCMGWIFYQRLAHKYWWQAAFCFACFYTNYL